jgi:uncharacterized protein GlcG (DUF336 family)
LLGTGATVAALSAAAGPAGANVLPAPESLTAADVTLVLQQAVLEAQARSAPATVAVVDRVGNVLAVYRMNGAPDDISVSARRDVKPPNGLVGVDFPRGSDLAAAISKAITGAYLSSGGNAFTTRTASQIIQENFNPTTENLEGGPLFGVQISQLACSDFSVRFQSDAGGTIDPTIGPKRSPLGFAGDPGGLPLYKNRTLVGGVGVISDGVYEIVRDKDADGGNDETIARAATHRFGAPEEIKASRIVVDGRTLTFTSGAEPDRGRLDGASSVNLAATGSFVPVPGYYAGGGPLDGQAFGFGQSGYLPDPNSLFRSDRAFVLADAAGNNRHPPTAGISPATGALTVPEVIEILASALGVALEARAQIRQPLGSHVEVTISVVDTLGTILGIVRTPDAPVFGTDVSLQKARSAMFFSSSAVPGALMSLPTNAQGVTPSSYLVATQRFLGIPLNGSVAFGERSIGNIARPFYPDGINGTTNGPLSVPFARWSPFNTGLQVDLVFNGLLQHVGYIIGAGSDVGPSCTPSLGLLLGNGLQIFAGGVPIYRGSTLVGGIGISGDGIDQDDMVAFLGLRRAVQRLSTGLNNAPSGMRADRLSPDGANLRYVQCPFAPFLGSDDQNVCEG